MSSEYDFMCLSWKCLPKAPTVEEALNTQGDGAGGGGTCSMDIVSLFS